MTPTEQAPLVPTSFPGQDRYYLSDALGKLLAKDTTYSLKLSVIFNLMSVYLSNNKNLADSHDRNIVVCSGHGLGMALVVRLFHRMQHLALIQSSFRNTPKLKRKQPFNRKTITTKKQTQTTLNIQKKMQT